MKGIKNVTKVTNYDMIPSIFTLKGIKTYFFLQEQKMGNKSKRISISYQGT